MTNRYDPVFPHTITVFNRTGDAEASYTAAVVRRVRCSLKRTVSDGVSVISGEIYIPRGAIESDKPYLSPEIWEKLGKSGKARYWTIRGGGIDMIAEGSHAELAADPMAARNTAQVKTAAYHEGESVSNWILTL